MTVEINRIFGMKNKSSKQAPKKALRIIDVSDEIREAADEWVFEINGMKWSNNDDTAGDNFGSFIAGAKWVLIRFSWLK
jgi:hypothetical protein